jgi:endonuclease YncB( thermonuclease family)
LVLEEGRNANGLVVAPLLRLVSVLLLISPCIAASAQTITGHVVGISDGDTLTILDATRTQHRIRLDGIDAPEAHQAFGQRSRQSLAELAHRQQATADCPKVDKYQRKVCVVRVQGVDVGLAQIQRGLAWHFKRYAHEQSSENRATYAAAQAEAGVEKRGLWRDPNAIPPWEWRAAKAANRESR